MSAGNEVKLVHWRTFHRGESGRKVMHDGARGRGGFIYHMLPWGYAKRILDDRRLRLSPVMSWDDPFERWWCETLFGRPGPLSDVQAYGLCWTTGVHDEPRWRLAAFRRSGPIVRIRCRVDALLDAGAEVIRNHEGSMYLGAVRYRREKRLHELAASVAAGRRKDVTRTAAEMLLHKRMAFKFEDEVRLLWLDNIEPKGEFFLEMDPATVISQVMTSPYVDWSEHQKIRARVERAGLVCKRSEILREPPPLVPG